jgi:hypothetical protein
MSVAVQKYQNNDNNEHSSNTNHCSNTNVSPGFAGVPGNGTPSRSDSGIAVPKIDPILAGQCPRSPRERVDNHELLSGSGLFFLVRLENVTIVFGAISVVRFDDSRVDNRSTGRPCAAE